MSSDKHHATVRRLQSGDHYVWQCASGCVLYFPLPDFSGYLAISDGVERICGDVVKRYRLFADGKDDNAIGLDFFMASQTAGYAVARDGTDILSALTKSYKIVLPAGDIIDCTGGEAYQRGDLESGEIEQAVGGLALLLFLSMVFRFRPLRVTDRDGLEMLRGIRLSFTSLPPSAIAEYLAGCKQPPA